MNALLQVDNPHSHSNVVVVCGTMSLVSERGVPLHDEPTLAALVFVHMQIELVRIHPPKQEPMQRPMDKV